MQPMSPPTRSILLAASLGLPMLALIFPVHSLASPPRVIIIPAHMRNAVNADVTRPVTMDGLPRDAMEVAITEVIERAVQETGSATLVSYRDLLKASSDWDRLQFERYLSLGADRLTAFIMSPGFRSTAPAICDLVVVPQFSLSRIGTTGKSRIADLAVQYIYLGKGYQYEGVNFQQFRQVAKLKLVREFPMDDDIPELIRNSLARTIAGSVVPYFEEAQRIAMDGLMEELQSALEIGRYESLAGLLDAITSLTSVPIDDPAEAYALGRACMVLGRGADAVSWLTKARDGGLDPLQNVLATLGRAQAFGADYPSALISLEDGYKLSRRKRLETDGLLREMVDVARRGGLAEQEAKYLRMQADPLTYTAATDEERIAALMRAAALDAGMGQKETALATLTKIARSLRDGEYRIAGQGRDDLLLDVRASLKELGGEAEARQITTAIYDEAIARIRDGRIADGLAKLEPLIGDVGAEGLFWEGYALSKLGRASDSEASYKSALQLEPGLVAAAYNLRLQYLSEGRTDDILALYSPVHAAVPSDAHVSYGLALALMTRAEYDQALALLNAKPLAEEWRERYARASAEAELLKARAALAVDAALTLEEAVRGGSVHVNKTVDWRAVALTTKEGKGFVDVDATVPGGSTFLARFFTTRPVVPNGLPIRVVGRIIRFVSTKDADGRVTSSPMVAAVAVTPQTGMDYIGAPAGLPWEMLLP